MTCEEYLALLDKHLEDTATAEEEALLRRHEEACPACADRRQAMDALHQELRSLADDTPPMPDGLHGSWVRLIEEDSIMQNTQTTPIPPKKNRQRTRSWMRWAAIAAALVFVVGGTLLTREEMPRTRRTYSTGETTVQTAGGTAATTTFNIVTANTSSYQWQAPKSAVAVYDSMAMDDAMEDMDYPEEAAYSANSYSSARSAEAAQVRETKLIRNASLTIATTTFDESLTGIEALVADMGGWVSYSSVSTGSGSLRTASFNLRIPAGNLDAFLEGTGSAGRVTRRDITTNDVTDSYYDTMARLATQEALMERLQSLVTDAADLSDLLELESQIADTQYYIDSLKGSLQYTDQRVAYSTVDITLREEREAQQVTNTDLTFGERIASALTAGLEAFGDFLTDMAVFVIAALPFLIVVAVVVIVVVAVIRRRGKQQKDGEEK